MSGGKAMEVTRVVRPGGKTPGREPERSPSALPLERVALVALVFGRERASTLLEGLTAPEAGRAKALLVGFATLSSARRQARVAVEFGVRPDAVARLRTLMQQAPRSLRKEIFRGLPSYHRSAFPEERLEPVDATVPDAVRAWAERLVREATR